MQREAEGGGHLPFLHEYPDDERECGSWRPGLEARAAKKIRPRLLRGPRGQINETVWVYVWFYEQGNTCETTHVVAGISSAAKVFKAKESIPPAYVAWRASTSNRVVVPAWKTIPELLKRFTNSGSVRGVSLRFKKEEIR